MKTKFILFFLLVSSLNVLGQSSCLKIYDDSTTGIFGGVLDYIYKTEEVTCDNHSDVNIAFKLKGNEESFSVIVKYSSTKFSGNTYTKLEKQSKEILQQFTDEPVTFVFSNGKRITEKMRMTSDTESGKKVIYMLKDFVINKKLPKEYYMSAALKNALVSSNISKIIMGGQILTFHDLPSAVTIKTMRANLPKQ